MDSSLGIGTNHQPGAQNEPFFDLLQPAVTSSSSLGQNPPQNSSKMENSGEFNFSDDVLPSFDFQPIRTSGAPPLKTSNSGAGRMEESRSRQASPPPSYSSYEPMVRRSREPPPTYEAPLPRSQEHEKESFETATVAAVERTMKKYADNLLRVLEGMSGRLSQLESSTQRLEELYGEIRNDVVNNHGEVDGKLRSLENHILEVQRGVQLLRDRQELAEAQSQLAKLQAVTKSDVAPHNSAPSAPPPVIEQLPELSRASSGKALLEDSQQQMSNVASSHYQQPQPQHLQQLQLQLPSVPSHSLPQPLPQQQQQPQPQAQQHQPQQQQRNPSKKKGKGGVHQGPQMQQQSEVSHQILQQQQQQQQPPPPPPPPQQMSHSQHSPPPPPPPPPSQMTMPFYSQQQQPLPQAPPPMPTYGHQPEAPAYNQHPQGPHHVPPTPQSYPSDLPSYHPSNYGPPGSGLAQPPRQSSQIPPSSHIQQHHNVPMYDPSLARNGSGQLALPPPYLPQAQQVSNSPIYEPQSPGSGYPSSSYRVAQPVPSAPSGGGYPRLPVAQPLPHAMPAGGSGGGPPGTPPLSTNRVPIDEVIDKVTAMGFSKDQVRAVVRRLTENGQSVDLNIVLDKLMNGGDAQPPPKGWFGR
ncbi:protein MpFLOE [Marchantia polymorpha subsp. ruderalis]|uniref:UBA domain-containing protein n=2 Tax=Marchantia polymorpha TaxID=3197 RepID=A0A176WNP1_MARPO|nr:hypothetical protein AXG93_1099s1100 [Marchantia polymorpha subsp. ruderalis]PTQ33057.1 hypothetical protein MARPO_0092s0027 [Marchantia polymorpha]BBN11542.1 hypothetical protein Mp_5g12800 [Marchantia polymorpha subsp. ruderalis]|eukprot:PTQ33057.1 hypothetical protein MARPO_0092s0027 [Marchantia polymorpha]